MAGCLRCGSENVRFECHEWRETHGLDCGPYEYGYEEGWQCLDCGAFEAEFDSGLFEDLQQHEDPDINGIICGRNEYI